MLDTNNLMNLMIFATGAYIIYGAIIMLIKKEVPQAFLGQNVDIKKCRDVEGFRNYMSVKILFLGIIVLLVSGLGFINSYVVEIEPVYFFAGLGVMAIALIVFIVFYLKARKRFLD